MHWIKQHHKWIMLANIVLLTMLFGWNVYKKEQVLKNGQLVLMKLAPVDPRSLMQGDYMRLRYQIARDVDVDSIPSRGYCVVKLDANGVAAMVRIQTAEQPLQAEEQLIRYFYNDRFFSIGAEEYFMMEGTGDQFDQAEYGGLMVDATGHSVLTGLYDKQFQLIVPQPVAEVQDGAF